MGRKGLDKQGEICYNAGIRTEQGAPCVPSFCPGEQNDGRCGNLTYTGVCVMKKILATILALVMAIGVTTMAWATMPAGVTEVKDATELSNAINAGDVVDVKLGDSFTADVVIPAGKTVTIDLNGFKLTNVSGDTITVQKGATLIINGSGTVDNVTNAKAAIYNNGTVTLNGGKYTRSAEAANTTESGGGNSYYNILNHGDMTINAGVEVTSTGHFSSLIDNGYYGYSSTDPRVGYVEGTGKADPTLTINGGTFSGGINTIKNDDGAQMTINGGKYTNYTRACVQNHNVLTITAGEFDGSSLTVPAEGVASVVINCGCGVGTDKGQLTIEGGTYTGGAQGTYVVCDVSNQEDSYTKITAGTFTAGNANMIGKGTNQNVDIVVSGGTFKDANGGKVDVSQYLESGKQQNADGSVGNIPRYYYNSTTTTDTKKDDNKGTSPKTFDAGVGIYAVSAVLSVTGMAYVGKKKF